MFGKVCLKDPPPRKFLLCFLPVYGIIGFRNVYVSGVIMTIEEALKCGIANVEIECFTVGEILQHKI